MTRLIVGLVVMVGVLAMLVAVGFWWLGDGLARQFFAEDAVQVIAYEVSEMFESNPATTQQEIEARIRELHEASVINLEVDAAGRDVGPYGTAFRVEHRAEGGTAVTTVTSAGPDRAFGTEDDIRFTDKRETPAAPEAQDGEVEEVV